MTVEDLECKTLLKSLIDKKVRCIQLCAFEVVIQFLYCLMERRYSRSVKKPLLFQNS